MKKEQVLELMNAIPPDLIEEADLQSPAKRRLPRIAHVGLIAACLCIALLGGTAFAAIMEYIQISSANGDTEYTYSGRQMTKYPLSDFSPALNAASEARENPGAPVSLNFNTWDEVQAFLGNDIPCVWPEDWDGQFQVILFHTECEVLWGIDIHSTDLGRQAEIHAEIRTELWQNEYAQTRVGFPEGSVENLPSHTMPSGATALLVRYTGTQEHPDSSCTGYFMQAGILYEVTVISPVPPQNDMISQLHTLLDSFPASR